MALPLSFSPGLATATALAATSLPAYVDQTLMERICNSLPANARGANIKSKSSTGTVIC